jgi:polyisoprenoid-binding protein YceI
MQTLSGKLLIVSGVALAAAAIGQSASADPYDSLRWQTVTGIAAPNGVVGSGTGAITGAPGPWSALGGKVRVDPHRGRIEFSVDGLVLAAGNSIGTPGTVTQVKGTVVCDTDGSASGGNSVLVDTPLVELDDQGDARFNGGVTIPAVCASELDVAFLLRTVSGRWIANGSVLR